MGILTFVCKQCGGKINLDDSREFGFCSQCGTKIMIQDEIHTTNISNIYNTTNQVKQEIVKNIYGREQSEAEDFIRNGEIFLKLGEYVQAAEAFQNAIKQNAGDWRGWMGMVGVRTRNYTFAADTGHLEYLEKAKAVANEAQKAEIEKLYGDYAQKRTAEFFEIVDGCLVKYKGSDKNVVIPNGVTNIGGEVFFKNENITSVTIPDSMTTIGKAAFFWCKNLKSVTIPSSITSIGAQAFSDCAGLSSIPIPSSVTSIGAHAFSGCASLTSITVPSSVTSIEDYTFHSCGLTSIPIPSSVTSIGAHAFAGCAGLISVTVPSSVTNIGDGAFGYCTSLTSITIPSGVTSIGKEAFFNCPKLKEIYVNKKQAKGFNRKWLSGCNAKIKN